jgi:hypothetical protein
LGLALPSFYTPDKLQGQGKPSPYETRKLSAKKTRIYGIAKPSYFSPRKITLRYAAGQ